MSGAAKAGAWPSVSVIMPCFNAEHFIADALRSILAQQYLGELEILVVDDGSTDESIRTASAFDHVIVLSQKNAGPAAARNLALKHARGDVVAFLDADDLWTAGSLQARVERLVERPDVGIAFGDFSFWTPALQAASAQQETELRCVLPASLLKATNSGWVYPEILLDPIVHIIATLVRRSVFDAIGAFDSELRTGEDYDFFIRAAHHCKFSHVDAVVARYRQHASSITRVPQPQSNEYTVVCRAVARYGTSAHDGRKLDEKLLAHRMQKLCFDHAFLHLRHGEPGIAFNGFRAAIKHYPWRAKSWLFAAMAAVKKALEQSPSRSARKP